jgi:hypothetical protein
MLAAAALALSLFGSHAKTAAPPADVHYGVGRWRIDVHRDSFTGRLSCKVHGQDMKVQRNSVIFHLAAGVETTHAWFKIDAAPARPVSDAFAEEEANGYFPMRGWIDDPAGGDVALPVSYFDGAYKVMIRASPKYHPKTFRVTGLAAAVAAAKNAGCPAESF